MTTECYYTLMIDKIRSGDLEARDQFIAYFWKKIKRYVKKTSLKEKYQEEAISYITIKFIEYIDNNNFDSKNAYAIIHSTIARWLYNYLCSTFMINYDGQYITWDDYPKKCSTLRQNNAVLLEQGVEDIAFSNLPPEDLSAYERIHGLPQTTEEDLIEKIVLKELVSDYGDIYKYILFSYLGLGDCDVKNARKLASELKRPSSLVFEAYSFMLRYIKDNLETEGIYHR